MGLVVRWRGRGEGLSSTLYGLWLMVVTIHFASYHHLWARMRQPLSGRICAHKADDIGQWAVHSGSQKRIGIVSLCSCQEQMMEALNFLLC